MSVLKHRCPLAGSIIVMLAASLSPLVSFAQNRPPLQAAAVVAAGTANAQPLPLAQTTPAKATALKVGERRPYFKLKDLEGDDRHVSEWDGKLVFLNFWATWCPPCLHEISTFSRLQDEYAGAGVQFLGVALDNVHDVKRFIAKHGMRYPTLHGSQDAIHLSKIYGNPHGSLPFTVVIGRDGRVLHTHAGVLQRAQAQALILKAL